MNFKNPIPSLIIVACLFCANPLIGFAQYKPGSLANGIIPNVIPASPEAGSLGKFGEWPVSYYTGIPNISIPIYTISTGGFQLPIQLSYHAGGVKLDEVGGWVGTNWSLSAGGVISRTIVGMPDEDVGGFLYRNQRNDILKTAYDLNTPADYVFMAKAAKQEIDVEPDIFSFNFAGISGRLYFDKTGNFQAVPANNLKLLRSPINNTLNYSDDKHWEIADDKGNIYFFAAIDGSGLEKTMVYHDVPSASQLKPTGWYLTKIILANQNDVIYFDYSDKSEHYDLTPNHSLRILTSGYPPYIAGTDPATGLPGTWDDLLKLNRIIRDGESPGGSPSTFSASGKSILKKIRWTNGEIIFDAITPRQDVSGIACNLLDNVSVYSNGKRIKEFLLKYNFFNQRACLTSFVESDGIVTHQLKHTFEYISPGSLPQKGTSLAFAQDHWGFFNGAISNNSLLPPSPDISSTLLTANREPNESSMQYGTLKKIIYPTGGYSEFEYEAHKFDPASPVGGSPSSQITSSTINLRSGDPQTSNFYRVQNFNIGFTQGTPNITLQFTNYNKPASKELAWLPLVKLEKLINGAYQQIYYWDAYNNFPIGNVQTNQNGFVDFNLTQNISFDPGDYRLITDLVCGVSNCGTPIAKPAIDAKLTYYASTTLLPIAGGLRIKQITNYSNGNFSGRKRFLYAPGKLLIYPRYIHQYAEEVYNLTLCAQTPACRGICDYTFVKYKEITSTSQSILGFTQGAPVGYTFVTVKDINSADVDNGFIDYTYSFTPDVLNSFNYDPSFWSGLDIKNACVPLNNFEYKRGLPATEVVYKKNSYGTYNKIHSLTNAYEFHDNDISKRYNALRAMRIKKMRTVNYPCGTSYSGYTIPVGTNQVTGDYAYAYYDAITSWVEKTSTTETTYDENGNNPLSITSNYTYNNSSHLQVTGITMNDSKGNLIKSELKYPNDFSVTSPYDVMVVRNIISPVIEEVQTNVTLAKELSRTKINYQLWQGNTLIQPVNSQKSILGNALEIEATINGYDNKGNILQVTKKDGIITSYIWGYSKTYPVAEVINAKSNEIYFESFEETGGWDANLTYDNAKSRSGKYSGKITKSTAGELYSRSTKPITISISTPTKYRYSGWIFSNGPAVEIYFYMKRAGETGYNTYLDFAYTFEVNKWVYIEKEFTVPSDAVTLDVRVDNDGGGTVWFDDLRISPSASLMTTYTYDPLIGITSQSDANNKTIYYSYDDFGRLQLIKDQDGKILKKICYNYAGQTQDCNINVTPAWTATGNLRCVTSGGNNTGYQEREEMDGNPNSPAHSQTRWVVNAYNTTACPLPAPPCSLSAASGYSIATSSISSSGSIVSFYLVFSPTGNMDPGNSYFVTTINGSCRPSITRTIPYSSAGRNWTITIYPSGQMYWYLAPGSTSVTSYSTIGTNTLTYNL